MGNCQAAEATTVVIQHPTDNGNKGKVERIYHSIPAKEVMGSNPGYYIALVLNQPQSEPNGPPLKNQLKLLRPDDTLHIGHVYRLISFEDVLKEFTAKKSVRLGKLLKESGVIGVDMRKKLDGGSQLDNKTEEAVERLSSRSSSRVMVGRPLGIGRGQWKPALQSIAESATS